MGDAEPRWNRQTQSRSNDVTTMTGLGKRRPRSITTPATTTTTTTTTGMTKSYQSQNHQQYGYSSTNHDQHENIATQFHSQLPQHRPQEPRGARLDAASFPFEEEDNDTLPSLPSSSPNTMGDPPHPHLDVIQQQHPRPSSSLAFSSTSPEPQPPPPPPRQIYIQDDITSASLFSDRSLEQRMHTTLSKDVPLHATFAQQQQHQQQLPRATPAKSKIRTVSTRRANRLRESLPLRTALELPIPPKHEDDQEEEDEDQTDTPTTGVGTPENSVKEPQEQQQQQQKQQRSPSPKQSRHVFTNNKKSFTTSTTGLYQTNVSREAKLERSIELLRRELKQQEEEYQALKDQQASEIARLEQTVENLSLSNTQLEQEKINLQQELEEQQNQLVAQHQEQVTALQQEAEEDISSLEQQLEQAHATIRDQEAQINELTAHCDDMTAKVQDLEKEQSSTQSNPTVVHNRGLQTQLNKLRVEHQEMQKQAQEAEMALEQKCRECLDLTEEKNKRLKELDEANVRQTEVETALERRHQECLELTNERAKLQRQLEEERSQRHNNKETRDSSTQTDPQNTTTNLRTTSTGMMTHQEPDSDVPSVSLRNKLTQIQVESERNGMIRQHHREMERLLQNHDEEIQSLEHRFTQRLKAAEEQAQEEQMAKIKEVQRHLTTEYEERIQSMERQHRKDLKKVREGGERRIQELNESLDIALAQASAATQECENETRKRKREELKLQQLQHDYEVEKQDILHRHEQEVASLHSMFEEERTDLLQSIQQGCNKLIDDSRVIKSSRSVSSYSAQPPPQHHHHVQFGSSTSTSQMGNQTTPGISNTSSVRSILPKRSLYGSNNQRSSSLFDDNMSYPSNTASFQHTPSLLRDVGGLARTGGRATRDGIRALSRPASDNDDEEEDDDDEGTRSGSLSSPMTRRNKKLDRKFRFDNLPGNTIEPRFVPRHISPSSASAANIDQSVAGLEEYVEKVLRGEF